MTLDNNQTVIRKSCPCGEKNHVMTIDHHPKTGVKMTIITCSKCGKSETKYN